MNNIQRINFTKNTLRNLLCDLDTFITKARQTNPTISKADLPKGIRQKSIKNLKEEIKRCHNLMMQYYEMNYEQWLNEIQHITPADAKLIKMEDDDMHDEYKHLLDDEDEEAYRLEYVELTPAQQINMIMME